MQVSRLYKFLPPLRPRAWLTLVLPLALALSFLIATGGELQRGLTSVLRSDAPSLYAAASGEAIERFPNLGSWLLWGLDPVPLILAFMIIGTSLYARTVLLASLFVGVGTFVGLTLLDLLMVLSAEDQQISGWGVSVSANLLAGCAIGIATVLALKSFTFMWRKAPKGIALMLFPIGVVVASVSASTILYLILYFFFHPTSVHLEARLEAPAKGFFFPADGSRVRVRSNDEPFRPFSIIPPETPAGYAEATFIDAQALLSWSASTPGPQYEMRMTVVTDCPSIQPFERAASLRPNWVLRDIRSFGLQMDAGLTYVFIDRVGDRNYTVDVEGPAFFWIKPFDGATRQQRSVEAYVRPASRLIVQGGTPLRLFLNAPLTDVDDQRRAISVERTMRLTVDGEATEIRAGGRRDLGDRPLRCATAGPSVEALDARELAGAFSVGILVEIVQAPNQRENYLPNGGRLLLNRLSGSVEIFEPMTATLSDRRLGEAASISVSGHFPRAYLDGVEVKADDRDGFDGFGEFVGYLDDGGYRLTGQAAGLWRNQRRVNPTRWERLPVEIQATLLGAMGILLVFIGRFLFRIFPHLKRDEELFLKV
jgi:hypothetical protein